MKLPRFRYRIGFAVVAAAALALTTEAATAAFIVQPDPNNVDAPTAHSGREPKYALDGGGLSNSGTMQTGDPVPSTWPGHNNNCCGGDLWLNENSPTPTITFDLRSTFSLSGLHVWNYNEGGWTGRSVDGVDISFSTTSMTSGFSGTQTLNFKKAPGDNGYVGESYSFSGTPTARYVRFEVLGNHSDGNRDRSGLSELRFTAIPEPASLALLAPAGLMMLRRRRS